MKCLKIDFLIRSLGAGGAERQLVILAAGLQKRGHQVRIITFYDGKHYEAEAKARELEIINLKKGGRWDILGFTIRLMLTWVNYRPDIIHSYMGGANLMAAMLKLWHHRPVVWGIRSSQLDLTQYDWLASIDAKLEAFFSRHANLTIANSEAGRNYVIGQGFPKHRIAVIYNGFECQRWFRNSELGKAFREQYHISEQSRLLGLVARLEPAKGHEIFLKAAALVAKKFPKLFFIAIGAGPDEERERLKAMANALDIGEKVLFLLPVKNMVPVYSALDGLVSASLSEGFPNVIAEAMACGLQPVVTDVGDSARIVGPFGWIVKPGDAWALAGGIEQWYQQFLMAGETIISDSPRQHIECTFGVDRLVTETESLLLECTLGRS